MPPYAKPKKVELVNIPVWKKLLATAGTLWSSPNGATAVEFALVVTPFIALLMANIETAVMMFTSSVVQGGIMQAARQVRTGQVTSSTTGSCPNPGSAATIPAAFSNAVCNNLFGQVACSSLTYDVRSYGSFSAANNPWTPTYDAQGNLTNNCFDTGGGSGIVTIRVAYNYSFITPGLNYLLGSGTANGVGFVYTVIIQNEPF